MVARTYIIFRTDSTSVGLTLAHPNICDYQLDILTYRTSGIYATPIYFMSQRLCWRAARVLLLMSRARVHKYCRSYRSRFLAT